MIKKVLLTKSEIAKAWGEVQYMDVNFYPVMVDESRIYNDDLKPVPSAPSRDELEIMREQINALHLAVFGK